MARWDCFPSWRWRLCWSGCLLCRACFQVEDQAFLALQSALEKRGEGVFNDPQIAAAPVTQVMNTLMTLRGASFEALQQAAEIAVAMQRQRLRRYLSTLATIGSTAPFIGLFGTVLGVLQAFEEMGKAGSNVEGSAVAGHIGSALSATAVGLLVAIPSVMAYNFLVGRSAGRTCCNCRDTFRPPASAHRNAAHPARRHKLPRAAGGRA